jgi:hypothetical protein
MPVLPDDFTVEIWTEGFGLVYRTLARCARGDIAQAAYIAALREFPDQNLMLRHRTRTIEEHRVK